MTRREAMKLLFQSAALASIPAIPKAAFSSNLFSSQRPSKYCSGTLHVINAHTNEELNVRYLNGDGQVDQPAIEALDYIFRCHDTDEIYPMPPELYVLLDVVRTKVGPRAGAYELISGYRSAEYNRQLRRKSRGVAKQSYHVKGMAADVCLQGASLAQLRRTAIDLKKGGVGKYRKFIHLDIGPVRSW